MKIPSVHRRPEGMVVQQGINWNTDKYTLFQLILQVWRIRAALRIRRKSAFGEFTKACPRWYYEVTFLDVYKDGFRRLIRHLWYSFDFDLFKVDGSICHFEQLPTADKAWLALKEPAMYNRYTRSAA